MPLKYFTSLNPHFCLFKPLLSLSFVTFPGLSLLALVISLKNIQQIII